MANEENIWSAEQVKEFLLQILSEKEDKYNQRFSGQEKAIETAERSRDVAIKKAEDSIEKKSDAVYVKLTDLQKALTEVMLRPEIESRLAGLTEKYDDLKTSRDTGEGKGVGRLQFWGFLVAAVAVLGGILAIVSRFIPSAQ